jgi:iron complex outermembrane recepter protein
MRKLLFLLTALTTLSFVSYAQLKGGKVSGTVIDGNTKTIESATITLLRAKDSSVAKISVADKTGKYNFEGIADGQYFVSITAVGHQKGYSEAFEVNAASANITLKTIELVPQASTMGNVTVSAKKPLIEQKIDRTVVNVEASITNVGNSALEVLEKAPGVSVDKDGNISLKGKDGVTVYIDGRPSYLSGADLANLLRSMNASQLDQIEIMTNPPARYEAAGNSGIINIKTKKNKQFGYNGNINLGYTQGRYARFNESINFNYRAGKINLFTNLNSNRNHRSEDLYIKRNFREATTKEIKSMFDQATKMENENYFHSAKIGLDYSVSKKTTLGLVLNGWYNPSTWQSNTHTYIYDPNGVLEKQTKSFTHNNETWKSYSGNFNFRTTLDSAGQELTADLDYVTYRATNTQPLYTTDYDAQDVLINGPDTLLGNLPQDITIYSGKIDYLKPLKNDTKFEAGIKASYVTTDNDATYTNMLGGTSVLDSARRNHFIYDEKIYAAYVNYSKKLSKKFSAQLGLRLEHTNSQGHSTGYTYSTAENKFEWFDSTFKREYTQLFPTAYLQYTMNEKNSFVLNYGRRINRPNYGDLNPFVNFLDRYTFEQGNPRLKPQFSHNIELSHTYAGFLTSTLNYSGTTDIIQQVVEQNENTNETYVKKANIATRRQVGLSISAYKQINKWWSGNIYTNVFNNHFEGIVNNEPVTIGFTGFMFQAQQQFKWGKGWGAEVSGFYRTKAAEGVFVIKSMGQVGVGFSKQILKNNGTIRISARDIFLTQKARGSSRYGNVDLQFRNINDSRTVGVNFSWRFNKGKLKAGNNRKSGSASDEQNRVGAGN